MPRTIADFVGIHHRETAWLFGKGPTLDRFDMASAGQIRCAVNDVVRYVPEAKYCFACDGVGPWAHLYQPAHVLFQPRRTFDRHDMRNPESFPCEVVPFVDMPGTDLAGRSAADLVSGGLAIRRGTIGSAIQILHIMGISKIVCVGIDGGGGRAAREWQTNMRSDHHEDYNDIRDGFISAAELLGIELEFFGLESKIVNTNGTITVRILSGCGIGSGSAQAGDILDLHPRDAKDLLRLHLAEPFVRHPALSRGTETTALRGPEEVRS